ncbi:thyrostimulin alpha-2 subunit-like [Armigeres subalbatus]|uniref:thyrostimulin alpha-2 subunit-like n=1 Tax=Armigeres subalbatus TaxID=124917 RepID=UPI002ED33A4F
MKWLRITTLILLASLIYGREAWQRPGCHKIGHTRKISIPDCVEFSISTNACRGFCESFAVPSDPFAVGLMKPIKPVTSVGQCCNIMETEDVKVRVFCVDGIRNLIFKSAIKCACYHCKKE